MRLKALKRNWDALARRDPYWAVLTSPARQGARWDEEEFYRTGAEEVERLVVRLTRSGLPSARARALDFGCGVGRITIPLARHFGEVVGVDIAEAMLERARARDADGRCRFVLNAAPDLRMFGDGTFDLVYCRLVLQHVRGRYAAGYIRELIRVSRPEGAVLFQIPTPSTHRAPGGAIARALPPRLVWIGRRVKRWVRRLPARWRPLIEDYGLSRETVLKVVENAGASVLEVMPDSSHGTDRPGFEYLVTRRA